MFPTMRMLSVIFLFSSTTSLSLSFLSASRPPTYKDRKVKAWIVKMMTV